LSKFVKNSEVRLSNSNIAYVLGHPAPLRPIFVAAVAIYAIDTIVAVFVVIVVVAVVFFVVVVVVVFVVVVVVSLVDFSSFFLSIEKKNSLEYGPYLYFIICLPDFCKNFIRLLTSTISH
jgi:hypothetical protein